MKKKPSKMQSKDLKDRLYAIAQSQEGLFTAQQAQEAGFDKRHHSYHIKSGNWIRELRGVFRLKNFPYSEDSELVKWFLWSRNKEGCPQGIFSHYTALRIYEISDAMPSRVHMIVPKTFRKQAIIPKDLVLYKGKVFSEEIHEMKGFKVTKPLRTFYDLIHSGLESKDSALLYQSIRQALQEGFMTRTALKKSKLWAMIKENNWSFS